MTGSEPPEALAGLKVLEWSSGLACAYAGKILADLGAEVLKVEPPTGHPLRSIGPFAAHATGPMSSGRFVYLNTGKQSVVYEQDSGYDDRLLELVGASDVVISDESVRPDLGERLLSSVVWCSITPFGLTGPYAGYGGNHLTIFHAGGEGHLLPTGRGWEMFPDRAPVQAGSDIGEYDAGANAVVAILAAVIRQHHQGVGDAIDVSTQEAQLTLNRTRLSRYNHDRVELRRGPSPYPVGGMLRCRDGYVQLLGPNEEHWQRLGSLPGGEQLGGFHAAHGDDPAPLGQALREWCGSRSKAEVVTLFAAAGAPVGAYASPEDLLHSAQLEARSFFREVEQPGMGRITLPGPPYRLSGTPVRVRPAPEVGSTLGFSSLEGRAQTVTELDPQSEGSSHLQRSGPLDGVRVLDFTWAAAGPYATLLLAFLGAEVIKVESTRRLDAARRGFMTDYGGVNRSPNFNELNLNKRSFQVDLTDERGLAIVKRLVALSDVVVNNFRPGVMDRYGLGADDLLAQHPGLIVASSSANGSTGPESSGAGLASIFGAAGGLGEQTGYADGPPSEVGESTDYRSANALAVAILAALYHRRQTGDGQAIDLASREVVIATAPDSLLAHVLGSPWQPRIGNDHRSVIPHGVYPSLGSDEWIAIAARDETEWRALCAVLERPGWAEEFAATDKRALERQVIDTAIADWTRLRTVVEAFTLLQEAGVTAAPSFTNRQLASDPHLAERGVFVNVDHPEIGSHTVMRAPWRMSNTPCEIWRHGPLLGQDNGYVLETLLGLARDAYSQWEETFR